MNNKKLAYAVLAIIIMVLAFLVIPKRNQQVIPPNTKTPATQGQEENIPKILSTKPDPLDGSTVSADATVEITFSHPLENAPEFKHRIDPEIEYNLELSSDRKTVKITPKKAFVLGITYTLFISQDAKFEGGGRLDGEKIFHFKTIRYRGV